MVARKRVLTAFALTDPPRFLPLSILLTEPSVGSWEAGLADDEGSVSGTNRFDITSGQTITYSLGASCTRAPARWRPGDDGDDGDLQTNTLTSRDMQPPSTTAMWRGGQRYSVSWRASVASQG